LVVQAYIFSSWWDIFWWDNDGTPDFPLKFVYIKIVILTTLLNYPEPYTKIRGVGSLSIGDVNGDGELDIVVLTRASGTDTFKHTNINRLWWLAYNTGL